MTESTLHLPRRQVSAVRMRLGPEQPAPPGDALGRDLIGYAEGLSPAQLWLRGRGVWKARLDKVADCALALIVYDGRVVQVGTVEGVSFHLEDRVAVEGRPLPGHPLVGQPDPLHNDSRNPIAYGKVEVPATAGSPAVMGSAEYSDAYADLLAQAVTTLTAAARLPRPVLRRVEDPDGRAGASSTPGGAWEVDPTRTEPTDWAEFVTLALAGAAANVGGIGVALAGRPGSWEAAGVEQLLESTVGPDEAGLWAHRTEPLRITLHVDELLADHTETGSEYDTAFRAIRERITAAEEREPEVDLATYAWIYDRDSSGEWQPHDPAAPAWSLEAWKDSLRASGTSEQGIAAGAQWLEESSEGAWISKTPEAEAEYYRLVNERDQRLGLDDEDRLEELRLREAREYGAALKTHIEHAAAQLDGLNVPVEIVVDVETYRPNRELEDFNSLTARLIDAAVMDVPSPADLPGTPLERLDNSTKE
ncbi:hypothetical protein [Nocardioides sp. GXZ039]|uniref:hypothetical protein n=1 Tax=Nocardioides sp. GXZ039 TaxID=3136018 RepID=UPI0030F41234